MKLKHLLLVFLLFLVVDINAQYYNNAAAVFNGTTSYIAVPPSMETDMLTSSHQYTIEAWIYPTSYTNYPTIVGKNYHTSYWLGLNTNGKIRFYPGAGSFFEGDSIVPLNKWSHVAASFNETTAIIYLNGDSIVSNTLLAGPIGSNSDSVFIGCDRDASNDYFFTGKMDMVRLWNKVRTRDQIRQYMHVPLVIKWPSLGSDFSDLVASYNLDGNASEWSGGINDYGLEHNMSWDITGNKISPYVDFNNALILDGNSHASAKLTPDLAATTALTIEAWICRDRHLPYTNSQQILSKSGPTLSYNYGFSYQTDSSSLAFSTLNLSSSSIRIYKNNVLNDDKWHHIAATYNSVSGKAILYIDGDSVAGATYSTHPLIADDGDSLYIGKQGVVGLGNLKFKGMIDEIRIWKDTALPAKQIRDNMFVTYTTFVTPPTHNAGINFGEYTNFIHSSNGGYSGVIKFMGNCKISSSHLNDEYQTSPVLFTPFDNVGTNYLVKRSFLDISSLDVTDSIYCSDYGTLTSMNMFVLLGTPQPFFHQLSIIDPSGTSVDLTGTSTNDLGGKDIMTVFNNALSSLSGNNGPYSPNVIPLNSFSAFTNKNIHGWWKINSHQFTMPTLNNTLYGWGIDLNYTPLNISEYYKDGFVLSQNNPNPVGNNTVISFTIPNTERVKLTLTNALGQCIKILVDKEFDSGNHNLELNELNLPCGLYYYTMKAGSFSATRKMIVTSR